jgi:threonine dehydrogenase-like Zn-dependent dehydrogenase
MRGAVMHGPGGVRVEEREAPQIVEPTDAIIRVSAACVCGSVCGRTAASAMPMGHEYVGVVEEVDAVTTVKPGEFVVSCFRASDHTCARSAAPAPPRDHALCARSRSSSTTPRGGRGHGRTPADRRRGRRGSHGRGTCGGA